MYFILWECLLVINVVNLVVYLVGVSWILVDVWFFLGLVIGVDVSDFLGEILKSLLNLFGSILFLVCVICFWRVVELFMCFLYWLLVLFGFFDWKEMVKVILLNNFEVGWLKGDLMFM